MTGWKPGESMQRTENQGVGVGVGGLEIDVASTHIGTIAPSPVRLKSSSINSSLTSAKYSCPTILQ